MSNYQRGTDLKHCPDYCKWRTAFIVVACDAHRACTCPREINDVERYRLLDTEHTLFGDYLFCLMTQRPVAEALVRARDAWKAVSDYNKERTNE